MRTIFAAPMRSSANQSPAPEHLERHSLVTIRPAVCHDIPEIMKLERQSRAAAHWSEQEYRRLVESAEWVVLIAEDGASTATDVISPVTSGVLVAHHIPPDWELENIVVAATAQRQGIASLLLEALFARARKAKSDTIFLEVRESNTPARALYVKAGFRLQARRKSYYTGPMEDAILYSLKLR